MDYMQMLMEQSAANSAFNAAQSQINRDWQEYMSSTAHQREVNDLITAGINPVLSANNGASFGTVANSSADPSSAAGLAQLAMTQMNNKAQLEMSKISADAQKAAAGATAAATIAAANTAYNATTYAADRAHDTAVDSATFSVHGPFGSGVSGPNQQVMDYLNSPSSALQQALNAATKY